MTMVNVLAVLLAIAAVLAAPQPEPKSLLDGLSQRQQVELAHCHVCEHLVRHLPTVMSRTPRGATVKSTYQRKGVSDESRTTASWAHDVLEHSCPSLHRAAAAGLLQSDPSKPKLSEAQNKVLGDAVREMCPVVLDDLEDAFVAFVIASAKAVEDSAPKPPASPCKRVCKAQTSMQDSVAEAQKRAMEDAKRQYLAELENRSLWEQLTDKRTWKAFLELCIEYKYVTGAAVVVYLVVLVVSIRLAWRMRAPRSSSSPNVVVKLKKED